MKVPHIHIAIAEPSVIIREGVVSILKRISTLSVDIVEIEDLSNFADRIGQLQPDILIVNPAVLGLYTPLKLREDLAEYDFATNVVALLSMQQVIDLAKIGYDEVISIYDSVESIGSKLSNVVDKQQSDPDSAGGDKSELSVREREIVVCVVKGMTNKQIAESLFLSTHTVIAHRRNISNKLQIHSPAGLTIYAIVNKLVDISEVKDSISSK
ncbi:MAG: response regulator transcription factor [Rikenellaceae bacterium]